MFVIKTLSYIHKNLVLEHYQKCGYTQGINNDDIILAAFAKSQIIGAVRLCPESSEYFVLRGMQVKKEYQRNGIGRALLSECSEILTTKTCYCLPYKHLIVFYNKANFAEIKTTNAPQELQQRLQNYLNLGLSVTLMKRF